ncbi:MAG TPA: NAD+ synthase [Thermomicrobiales bacterium]|nr:NAD+ synthase [Thermomicrobiales bacterium]
MSSTSTAFENSPATESAADLVTAISNWLRERLDEGGADRFVLGLSGGIDSAVVCGLCVRAAGAERVLGVIMPSSSQPDDAASAAKVAAAFGVATQTVDLTSVSDSFYAAMPAAEELTSATGDVFEKRHQLAVANVRPRLRMTTLYYVANLTNGIVVGTGNKSEAMIGYFTKYGDGGVDLFPIIDLYKHEVREVARELGVPESVIERPPSAGLWAGQTDEDEIGMTYDDLDRTLVAIESGDTSDIDPATLLRVSELVTRTNHKRIPVPRYLRNTQ